MKVGIWASRSTSRLMLSCSGRPDNGTSSAAVTDLRPTPAQVVEQLLRHRGFGAEVVFCSVQVELGHEALHASQRRHVTSLAATTSRSLTGRCCWPASAGVKSFQVSLKIIRRSPPSRDQYPVNWMDMPASTHMLHTLNAA